MPKGATERLAQMWRVFWLMRSAQLQLRPQLRIFTGISSLETFLKNIGEKCSHPAWFFFHLI